MSDHKIIMPLEEIMGDRFGKYSKYIIQDRALPDVRDGLKPVQRRILYAMYKEGNTFNKPYRKSAKTVGVVIGNYHPHGDSSVYEAMVRMSQDWKMRAPTIDMQGNNGSIDNDPAAAMRYTEARLSKIANDLLSDIEKDTVNMSLNFDDTEYEPTVLPAKFPNILVNGATGISAGYATDIPPHNLHEIIDATIYRIQKPRCTFEDLMQFVQGPDFPTGAIVEGKDAIYQALKTGKGKVSIKSKVQIVEEKNFNSIVVDEIPYEINKSEMVRKIDEIRFNRSIDGIIEVRDESDRNGLRIVIEVRKEANINNVLNYLYKNSDLQKNYSYNMVAIKNKRPTLLGLEAMLDAYIDHAIDFNTKKCEFELKKAKTRAHIVEGLIKAISILDEVVSTIRKSKDKSDAKNNLVMKFGFSLEQAEAIVMLQLYRLTNTDIVSLENEMKELNSFIEEMIGLLSDEKKMRRHIIADLKEIKKKYPFERLTTIKDEVETIEIDKQSMIIPEEIYVSITRDGYIKRISPRSYKQSETSTFGKKENDILIYHGKTNTIHTLLAFTNQGNYLYIPLNELEEFKWKEVGKHISYLVKLNNDEKIIDAMVIEKFNENQYVLLVSKKGQIKRTAIKEFIVQRYSKAIKCMNLKEDDELLSVKITKESDALIILTKLGYASMYPVSLVQIYGIKAAGSKGINVNNDEVIGMDVFNPTLKNQLALFTSEAKAKRVNMDKIPLCNKGNKGILLYTKNKKTVHELVGGIVFNKNNSTALITNEEYNNIELDCSTLPLKDKEGPFSALTQVSNILLVRRNELPVIEEEIIEDSITEESVEVKFERQQFDFEF